MTLGKTPAPMAEPLAPNGASLATSWLFRHWTPAYGGLAGVGF